MEDIDRAKTQVVVFRSNFSKKLRQVQKTHNSFLYNSNNEVAYFYLHLPEVGVRDGYFYYKCSGINCRLGSSNRPKNVEIVIE